jgi:hypothetical protein
LTIDLGYCGKATEEFVKGKLDIIELHNNQPRDYKALSYAWGDPTRNHVIHIDGEALGVATNLYNALLRLSRQPSQQSSQTDEDPLYLWIDAICVDQDNVRERNHQVPRMHTIYSAASGILVWLGCGSQRSAHSLSTVLGESSRPPPSGEYATEAVETLVHSAWTRRLWTVQEVALACGPVTVMYGSFSFPWTKLMVELNRTKVLENPGTLSFAKCFVQRRNLQRTPSSFKTVLPSLSKQPFSLTSLIRETIGFQFNNPSDRVYALLGMAGPDTRMSIPVDYNKPLLDVYMDAIHHILTYERSLNVLFIAIGEEFGVLPSLMEFSFPAWTRPLYVTFNDESDSFLRDGSPYSSWESWDNFLRFSIRAKIRRTRRTIEFNSNRRELLDEGRASGNLRPVFTMCRHEGLLNIRGMELGVVHLLSPEKGEPAAQWVCRELSLSLAEFKDSYWAPFWITIHMGLSKSLHIPQIYLEQNRLTIDESSDDDTMADEWVTRRSIFIYVDKLTGKLYFGSALTKPRQGDLVCILFGSMCPVSYV